MGGVNRDDRADRDYVLRVAAILFLMMVAATLCGVGLYDWLVWR